MTFSGLYDHRNLNLNPIQLELHPRLPELRLDLIQESLRSKLRVTQTYHATGIFSPIKVPIIRSFQRQP